MAGYNPVFSAPSGGDNRGALMASAANKATHHNQVRGFDESRSSDADPAYSSQAFTSHSPHPTHVYPGVQTSHYDPTYSAPSSASSSSSVSSRMVLTPSCDEYSDLEESTETYHNVLGGNNKGRCLPERWSESAWSPWEEANLRLQDMDISMPAAWSPSHPAGRNIPAIHAQSQSLHPASNARKDYSPYRRAIDATQQQRTQLYPLHIPVNDQSNYVSSSQSYQQHFVSAYPNTVSPSAFSNFSPASASASPPRNPIRPMKLHQPRPSRRIPIISLSELAEASTELLKPPSGRYPQPIASPVVLSPLQLFCDEFKPYDGSFSPSSGSLPYGVQPTWEAPHDAAATAPNEIVQCSCGCMETYTIR